MKITELKKQLNAMNKAKLISMPCKLYKANRQCQAIFDVEMCGASAEAPLIESCRKKIHTAFFGRQLSLKNARAVISDFRKASQNNLDCEEMCKTATAISKRVLRITENEIRFMSEELEKLFPMEISVYYEECIFAMQEHIKSFQ